MTRVRRCAALAPLLLACGAALAEPPAGRADPWESFNRGVFDFNEALDGAVVRPVAEAYRKVLPDVVRTGVANVFGNVEDAWSAVNQFLQGKPLDGIDMSMRVFTNTVIGLGGVFDVASEIGIERRSEDLGQTLGRWGFGPGPYLVVPIFGPRTLRDALALPFDRYVGLSNLVRANERYGLVAVELMQKRSELLMADRLADQLALDKYTFVRDAYLARRRNLVYDGNPPEEPEAPDEAAAEPADVEPAPRSPQ